MINDNKTDTQIIKELKMPLQTFYSYKKKIQKQDAQIWEKVHIDSAKYRASRLIQRLEECELLAVKIRDDENAGYRDRLEAGKIACEAAANIFKIVNEGPTFKLSLKRDHNLPYKASN